MANREQFWFDKLKTFVPECFFSDSGISEAYFHGIAKVLNRIECQLDEHFTETFICNAVEGFLDEHGLERNITRTSGELDFQLSERIKNITNSTSCVEIQRIVDALLDVGTATILEDFDAELFFDREDAFYNRGDLLIDPIYNVFSIIVDKQVHEPYSFFDRENFYDREDFIGRQDSSLALFELIVEAVNRAKALGVLYRLVERLD